MKLEPYQPLRQVVFDALREAILSGHFKPGDRLMEVQVADELGVSRTPVREAIRFLEQEGYVIMVPRKGAYVAGVTLKDIADVFEIRASLESLACSLAAERITEEELDELERQLFIMTESTREKNSLKWVETDTALHATIYKASRNERLMQILNHLQEPIQRLRTASLSSPGRLQVAVAEHKRLVEAIYDRDSDLAAALAKEHIENAEHSMMTALKNAPGII